VHGISDRSIKEQDNIVDIKIKNNDFNMFNIGLINFYATKQVGNLLFMHIMCMVKL